VTCPSYNSYQGLIAQGDLADFSWAPVIAAWGKNNRSAMLRLPGNRYCIENRAVDMSINPYLAAAISLAAGLDGVERRLDPGAPLNDDLYRLGKPALKKMGIGLLPRTLLHALESFEEDPISASAFGDYYKGVYLAHKTREWEKSFYVVSDEQRAAGLTFIGGVRQRKVMSSNQSLPLSQPSFSMTSVASARNPNASAAARHAFRFVARDKGPPASRRSRRSIDVVAQASDTGTENSNCGVRSCPSERQLTKTTNSETPLHSRPGVFMGAKRCANETYP
jgi:hypothetical protein